MRASLMFLPLLSSPAFACANAVEGADYGLIGFSLLALFGGAAVFFLTSFVLMAYAFVKWRQA